MNNQSLEYLKIERILKSNKELMKVSKLKRYFSGKIANSTFIEILDVMQNEGKIFCNNGEILWILTPRNEIDNLITRGLEI